MIIDLQGAVVPPVEAPATPTGISATGTSVAEGAASGTSVSVLKAIDANAGDTFTYKLVDDAGGRFALNGNSLVVADGGKLDFEQSTSHSVTVRATDQTGRFVEQRIAIAVSDVATESLKGSSGNDVFVGGGDADQFDGAFGDDKLSGGLGNDILTGDKGRDIFVFDTGLNKKTNVDKIVDFNHRDDTIHLAKSVFSKIAKKGVLSSKAFWVGDKRLMMRRIGSSITRKLARCSTIRTATARKPPCNSRPCRRSSHWRPTTSSSSEDHVAYSRRYARA